MMRYIGSKERLLYFIYDFVEEKVDRGSGILTFADLFTGTASVSKFFRSKGYRIIANDLLTVCVVWAKAALASTGDVTFDKLIESNQIKEQDLVNSFFPSNQDLVLKHLNNINGIKGFIYTEYSPEGQSNRMYFTGENATKIDAIRKQINLWKNDNLLNNSEEAVLIASLLRATNKVANIAGTYGAFLKEWDKRALNPIMLEPLDVSFKDELQHTVFQMEVQQIASSINADVVYLDPPYNFRQYGAYYHVLETIAVGDSPIVSGKTGLRPWQEHKSDFCYNDKAAKALKDVIKRLNCKHIFLSYNADGILEHEEIIEILNEKGIVDYRDISFQRYKSNSGGSGELKVKERLYYVRIK